MYRPALSLTLFRKIDNKAYFSIIPVNSQALLAVILRQGKGCVFPSSPEHPDCAFSGVQQMTSNETEHAKAVKSR